MGSPLIQGAGRVPDVSSVLAVALYDESGTIVHQHNVVVLAGGRAVPEAEAVEAARAQAAAAGHRVKDLKVAVGTKAEHVQARHRIDAATGAFVKVPDEGLGSREPVVR